jgi:very-short-patch-repair endonuclease
MSPLVVSQILPARPIFDLVVFDEASQVPPADAVPALLRAPLAVVAGDRRQLPPTIFFDSTVESDEESEEDASALVAGFESILDALDPLLRPRMLTWHYRSEDERLIAFSNHIIYDSGLITFPGASAADCLSHELIEHRSGVQVDTRSNDFEIERVVKLMIEHAHERPDESLGVIAMGQHHASRIEAALRMRIGEERDPALEDYFDESREERAFVKNLERVQGDERDAIILTVGYGKQPDGRLLYRFGPLNQEGGERRLNVAVTRARRRLTLVSSFSHSDMDPSKSSSDGVELLRRYLKYAESGGIDLDNADMSTPLNPFEIDVKHRLEQAGLTVIPQYGTSGFRIDFALPHPTKSGRFALAIETDGASYHSAPTARDRDRLRQQVLERMGWRFHRIWSTDWFNDWETETEKVLAAYREAIEQIDRGDRTAIEPGAATESEEVVWEYDEPQRKGRRPSISPGGSITDYSLSQLVALARWIKSDTLLRTEDQMLGEMMNELGFHRRGGRIVEALTRAIHEA